MNYIECYGMRSPAVQQQGLFSMLSVTYLKHSLHFSRPNALQSSAARGYTVPNNTIFDVSRQPCAAKCYRVLAAASWQLPHPTDSAGHDIGPSFSGIYRATVLGVRHADSRATKPHEQVSADENMAESELQ